MSSILSRYNKATGAAVGGAISLLVFVVVGVDVTDTVEKVLSGAAILAGVVFAPKNAE